MSLKPVSKHFQLRERVGKFLSLNPQMLTKVVVKHFQLEGYKRRTLYDIINRFNSGLTADRKPKTADYRSIPQRVKNRLIEFAVNSIGWSYAALGRRFRISDHSVKKILKEAGVVRKKRLKCPKSTPQQVQRQKRLLNILRRTLFKASNGVDIIVDDEAYFTVDGIDTHFNDFYYSHPCLEVPDSVAYRPKQKYPDKVMVWCAISPKGVSEPYIVKSGNAVSAPVYIQQCLTRLKKFIDNHYPDGNYIF